MDDVLRTAGLLLVVAALLGVGCGSSPSNTRGPRDAGPMESSDGAEHVWQCAC